MAVDVDVVREMATACGGETLSGGKGEEGPKGEPNASSKLANGSLIIDEADGCADALRYEAWP